MSTPPSAPRSHLQHENDFVHTAIEARSPGGARHTADDHVEHADAIADLEDETAALRVALPAHRDALALRLYRHLADFVGENLRHMHVEETQNQAALWALYSDDELLAIHQRLIASIPPPEMALTMGWMAEALNVAELAGLCAGMRAGAPAPVFDGLLAVMRPRMGARRWQQLATALALDEEVAA